MPNLDMYQDLAELLLAKTIRERAGSLHKPWNVAEAEFEHLLAGTIEWKCMSIKPVGVMRVWVTDGNTVVMREVYQLAGWEAWAYIRVPNAPATLPVDFTSDEYKVKLPPPVDRPIRI